MTVLGAAALRAAAEHGSVLQARGTDGNRGVLDASVIREYCLRSTDRTDPHGLRIAGAFLSGRLDLSAMSLSFPLVFDDCEFEEVCDVDGAELHSLHIRNCSLPGILANGVIIRRDLDLSRSVIDGAHHTSASMSQTASVWLCESTVGGRVLCAGTRIIAHGGRAIQADRIRVGGAVRLMHDFVSDGEVRMIGAQVAGSFELMAARINVPDGFALGLADVDIRGSLFLVDHRGQPTTLRGRMDLTSARISGQILMRKFMLEGPSLPILTGGPTRDRPRSAPAITAPRLIVGTTITIEDGCTIIGEMNLATADCGGLVVTGDCRFLSPGRTALDLTNADIRASVRIGPGAEIQGRIQLSRARLHGRLQMAGVALHAAEEGLLLDGYGLTVEGVIELGGLHADGGRIVLSNASCRLIDLTGAHLSNGSDPTLDLRQATVNGNVMLSQGFTSEGWVVLDGAQVAGRLDCDAGTFTCPAGSPANLDSDAISTISATFARGMHLGWSACEPSVDLTATITTVLGHDGSRWPSNYIINGLIYDRLDSSHRNPANPWNARGACAWLDGAAFDAGSYEQAARVFRRHGYAGQAEYILIRLRDAARREARLQEQSTSILARLRLELRYAMDWLFGRTVGYGYRPARALIALMCLLIAVIAILQIPVITDTMRAVDARGNVYAIDGRLVTVSSVDPVPRLDSESVARSSVSPREDACGNGQIRCFSRLFYGIDTVIPLVDLNQRSTWYPNRQASFGTAAEYVLNTANLLGWLLSTIVVLSFARLARTV